MTAVSEQIGKWLEHFTNQPPAPAWFEALRNEAFARFAELGFPTTHHEEWRFTNVSAIARTAFTPVAPDALLVYPESVKQLEPAQAEAHLARHAAFDRNPFVALNTAFLGNVVVLDIPRNAVIAQPIEITYEGTNGAAAHPRTLILVGANAQCTIVETYKGTGTYFTNAVTEIVVGDRAVVDHYKLQQEAVNAFHIATLAATIGRSAAFSSHSISLGGALVRHAAHATPSARTDATTSEERRVGK